MRPAAAFAVFAALLLRAAAATAADGVSWVLQASTGTALQARSRLVVEQAGEPDLDFTARYVTRPFTSGAPYYTVRIGRWRGGAAWEVESQHHLVTLVDPPEGIESFSLTHGYNLNTVNRAWLRRGVVWRLGAGAVVTHPESVVRGRGFSDEGPAGMIYLSQGFYLSGVCGQASVEKRLGFGRGFFLSLEGKGTAAWARVPIADGRATVPNYALHALAGVGREF